MSNTQVDAGGQPATGTATTFALEVVVIPVSDVDRAKEFYTSLGWRLDVDEQARDGYRLVHITPPQSKVSVVFGSGVTAAPPGSFEGLLLAVDDIDEARADLKARGVEASEPFHDVNGTLAAGFQVGTDGHAPGRDPENRSYGTYAEFRDPDGNRWLLQELTDRLPGRV